MKKRSKASNRQTKEPAVYAGFGSDSQQDEESEQLVLCVAQFRYRLCQQDLLRLQAAVYTHETENTGKRIITFECGRADARGYL